MIKRRNRIARRATKEEPGIIVSVDGTVFPYKVVLQSEWNFAAQINMNILAVEVSDLRTTPPTVCRCNNHMQAMNWALERVNGNKRTEH